MSTTQFASASYQEVIDLHTEGNSVSVVGIHTPTGDAPYHMLKGFFEQFQKYMYGGSKFTLVPAARLPADPLQVSYEAGETTIDPRDLMNPIMFKGCHGNDMNTILNAMMGNSVGSGWGQMGWSPSADGVMQSAELAVPTALDNMYYSALTDKTWLKANPQAGLKKSGLRPLVYQVASMIPLQNGENGLYGNNPQGVAPSITEHGDYMAGVETAAPYETAGTRADPAPINMPYVPGLPSFDLSGSNSFEYYTSWNVPPGLITPRLTRLGWLDTMTYTASGPMAQNGSGALDTAAAGLIDAAFTDSFQERTFSRLPKIYMGMLMLPPAYKTEQYFRLIIDHQFHFKKFRGISGGDSIDFTYEQAYNWNE